MANDDTINLWIRLSDNKPFQLKVKADEEEGFRQAEKMVNALYDKWKARFAGKSSDQEVMARVAFQFARLYAQAYSNNTAVESFLSDFEHQLDDIVVKVK